MCLILMAWQAHPQWPLIVAANRDEFHGRAAAPAAFWDDAPAVLAGRDLDAGGTWLGVSRRGRFAAVTNFSEEPPAELPPRSRGELTADFLRGDVEPDAYLAAVAQRREDYRGFNLLAGTPEALWYYSNRIEAPRRLEPGIYGLSNHLLDSDWPKVARGKSALAAFEEAESRPDVAGLLELLADDTQPDDEALRAAGLDPEEARRVAPCFIRGEVYGTRASTVLLMGTDGRVQFTERSFIAGGQQTGRRDFEFHLRTDETLRGDDRRRRRRG